MEEGGKCACFFSFSFFFSLNVSASLFYTGSLLDRPVATMDRNGWQWFNKKGEWVENGNSSLAYFWLDRAGLFPSFFWLVFPL